MAAEDKYRIYVYANLILEGYVICQNVKNDKAHRSEFAESVPFNFGEQDYRVWFFNTVDLYGLISKSGFAWFAFYKAIIRMLKKKKVDLFFFIVKHKALRNKHFLLQLLCSVISIWNKHQKAKRENHPDTNEIKPWMRSFRCHY